MELKWMVALSILLAAATSASTLLAGEATPMQIENPAWGQAPVVYGFASECGDEDDLQPLPVSDNSPKWIRRIAGNPSKYQGNKRVWIIDSGIATSSSIVSDLSFAPDPDTPTLPYKRICTKTDCNTYDADTDKIGHGTMIAGLIGAKLADTSANPPETPIGLRGVAPGVKLISLKIFDKAVPTNFGDVALKALEHVQAHANNGDVVNISWGMYYDWRDNSVSSQIESKLRELADRELWVVVAAGNTDVIGGSGYVQTISPARAGGDSAKTSIRGGIFTVSAVRTRGSPGNWIDTFWRFSAYGNGSSDPQTDQPGPPDYAAPGVGIESYWPDSAGVGKLNKCSGTSFSAALVSGLMVWGLPNKGSKSLWDRSAIKPDVAFPGTDSGADYYTTFSDPIATR